MTRRLRQPRHAQRHERAARSAIGELDSAGWVSPTAGQQSRNRPRLWASSSDDLEWCNAGNAWRGSHELAARKYKAVYVVGDEKVGQFSDEVTAVAKP